MAAEANDSGAWAASRLCGDEVPGERGMAISLFAFLWTSLALPVALREFPRRMLVRLRDLEASADGQAEWASHFHV